ncbi:hypothetical protein [Geoalkalibacter subterraneus]|uniref:hypothetical protein n=1 Tax=Geoalkalibacter subterraneus TaxID=483547 RepID=UPI00130D64A9|nr:hypothetical protein [Geoalkalibacter subterraneus]
MSRPIIVCSKTLKQSLLSHLDTLDGETIAKIYNEISPHQATYRGDDLWEVTPATSC